MPRVTVTAPYGGLNVLAGGMSLQLPDAITCTNFIPRVGALETRNGTTFRFNNGGAGAIQTVVGYSGLTSAAVAAKVSGTAIIGYGATLNAIATATWTSIASVVSGPGTSALWQSTQFGGLAIFTNGAATPQAWNGTAWAALVITGVTARDLIGCQTFKGRVYYWEANAQSFWYAAAGAYQGALTEFPLDQFTYSDGVLLMAVPVTIDGGAGPDDLLAFIFSNGEVVVYQGDDPASATDWNQIARFRIPQPRGYQGWAIIGATTIIDTLSGPVDLQRMLRTGPVDITATFGPKISGTVQVDPATTTRFQLLQAQDDRLLIRNHYDSSTLAVETLAMDMDSRNWCLFNGWENDATGMGVAGGALLIGDSSGMLFEYTNVSGDGVGQGTSTFNSVSCTALGAYTDLGAPGQRIRVTGTSLCVTTDNSSAISSATVGWSVDFATIIPGGGVLYAAAVSAANITNSERWLSISANGMHIAPYLTISTTSSGVTAPRARWNSTYAMVSTGGPL